MSEPKAGKWDPKEAVLSILQDTVLEGSSRLGLGRRFHSSSSHHPGEPFESAEVYIHSSSQLGRISERYRCCTCLMVGSFTTMALFFVISSRTTPGPPSPTPSKDSKSFSLSFLLVSIDPV